MLFKACKAAIDTPYFAAIPQEFRSFERHEFVLQEPQMCPSRAIKLR